MRVIVIGAGVMGASVAWHLTARGCRDVIVLDRGPGPGAGSTRRATGGFRAQYATSINVRLSLLAREKLRRFGDEVGGDCGYVPAGYLWLASSTAELEALDAARIVQHSAGLREAHAVTPSDVGGLHPLVAGSGVIGGAFCPTDGFISPTGLLTGYLQGAIRAGATVQWASEVIALERIVDRVTGVRTRSGRLDADIIVNAAGAWAGELAAASGLELPVVPLRRQVASTVPTTVVPPWMPMTIFTSDGFHFRERDGRVLLLWPSPGAPGAPFDTSVDDEWVRTVAATAHTRVPALRDVPLDRPACWAGLYEMSPDKHAILGAAPGCDGVFFINGSSGHGVMHAPALGHLLAEIILDGHTSTIDVRPLRPSRFAEGDLNPVSGVL